MRQILTICAAILALCTIAAATDIQHQQADMLQTQALEDAIPSDAKPFVDDISPEASGNFFENALRILKDAALLGLPSLKQAGKTAAKVFISVLLCTITSTMVSGAGKPAIRLLGALAISLCCMGDYRSLVQAGSTTIDELNVFSTALLPVMAGATAATGAVTSSAALYAGSAFFLHLLIDLMQKILVPMVHICLAMSIAGAALEQDTFRQIVDMLHRLIKSSLKILLFCFSAFISLTHIVSGNADALAVKAAKLTVSSVVPVVGSMISDATETVLVSTKLLKNSVGVFGMLSMLAIMIVPFLKLGIQYIVLQGTTILASAIGQKEHTSVLHAVSTAAGYLLGMVGCCGLMAFLACICFMKVTVM